MITLTGIKKNTVALGIGLLLTCLGQNQAQALPLTLPDSPLFVLNTVDPNVILTFDDSGSMAWGFVPDEIGSTLSGIGADLRATRRACSSTINGMAYDPNTTYTPPLDANGNSFPDATFSGPNATGGNHAWINGFNTAAGTRDLSVNYKPVWSTNSTTTTNSAFASCTISPTAADPAVGIPAFYFVYDPALAGTGGCPATAVTTDDDCYRLVQHNNAAAGGAWTATQQTNFANWYSYYRTRNLSMKSALTRAFGTTGSNVRIAYQRLNSCNAALGGTPSVACPGTYVQSLAGVARTNFFNWLNTTPASGGTPLVQAADRARTYMTTTNLRSPWAENPGVSVGTEHSCRQNFHMLTTDGRWNGGTSGIGNADNATATLPDGTAYPGGIPASRQIYRDTNNGFLADTVFGAWRTDARTTLNNNVPPYIPVTSGTTAENYFNPDNDPATWQHLTTFTVGFGVAGTLNPANYFDRSLAAGAGDYDDLLNGTKNWNAGNVVDDLWHAAINGRGEYFSAKDPTTLVNSFTKFLNQVASRTGSAASLSANGSTTSGGTAIYQVLFNTSNWAGRLLARQLDVNGNVVTDLWEAGTSGLNTQNYLSGGANGRNIITYNPNNGLGARGAPFLWGSLNSTQQDALNRTPSNALDTNGPARLAYLRGASANEGTGLNFRTRVCYDINGVVLTTCPAPDVGKLGDIINSSATYVGKPVFDYPDALELAAATYQSFRTAQAGRTPMVYVGGNDGMLHGFRADNGLEKIAYVPNLVYTNDATNNLSLLTWQSYTHRYYVDGTPTIGDVFYGGAWHTMLVGGLRKGGRGYYALDVTNPTSLTETNANNIARWEFTDPDLGYSFSQATIIKVADSTGTGTPQGKWVAIFGNGYNNTGTGHAVLFVVDIETGALIKKIDTAISGGGGSVATPNGLATPAVVDINDDHLADYVYAGDLQGNMWRFDIRSNDSNDWTLPTNVTKLFTARDTATSTVQPITEKPAVGFHPYGFGGLMVYFGTGKYLESSDNTTTGSPQVQSFYGIYDRGVTARQSSASAQETVLRTALLTQTISTNVTLGGFNTRAISNNPIIYRLSQTALPGTYLGWYVDLPTNGEKQVTDPVLREGRIIFTTLIPSTDPCTPGGTGWLMELNTENGGQLKDTFDLNGDGTFTAADRITVGAQTTGAAGIQPTTGGAMSSPIVLTSPPTSRPPTGGGCKEIKLAQATDGSVIKISETCRPGGREAWRQLK
jgi:type IV pilus assembly protein PilY1